MVPDELHQPTALPEDLAAADSPPDEAILTLTRALTAGHDRTWQQFFDSHQRRLRAYLTACWHGEPAAIDDLLQDTFLRAVKHMRPFSSEEALWSWLTVLARSAVADHGRKRSRFRAFLDRFRKEPSPSAATDDDPRLRAALQKLNPSHRQLIQWKYEESRSIREIASLLNTTEKAAESRLTRARSKLRQHLSRQS